MRLGKNMLGSFKGAQHSLQRFSEKGDFGLELKAVWFGVCVGLGVWLLSALGGIVWVVLEGAGTYTLGVFIYLVGILGVLMGAFTAGVRCSIKGWQHGLIVGIFLSLFGLIANLELFPHAYSWLGIGRQLLIWSLWGLFGGYVGSYFKAAQKTRNRRKKNMVRGF